MKKLFLLFLLIPAFLPAQTPTYPPLDEVVEEFFAHYTVAQPVEVYVGFERRPNGYFAVEMKEPYQPGRRELFYRFSTSSYSPLKLFEKREGQDVGESAKVFLQSNPYNISQFEMEPFFGYAGWYKDVIGLYEGHERLSDWELNALGRAYQTASASLLNNFSGYGDPDEQFDLPSGPNALTEAQVDQYLGLARKCLQTYDRLRKQNPDFMTPVGPVHTKYSGEVMDAFLLLLLHQNEETARQVLEPGLFDPYLLQTARNILLSCPPDAVLFTYGDNDTYPLYFVQATENLRTDVIIANLSLLVFPRYVAMVYSGPLGAKPLKTRLPDLYFQKLILWQKSDGETVGLDMADRFFDRLRDTSLYQPGFMGNYQILPNTPGAIELPVPADAPHLLPDPPKTVTWYEAGSYSLPDKTAQFDMAFSNGWSRPLCFSLTCRPSAWACWNPHLAMEGLVYRMYPDVLEPVMQIGDGVVNTETSYRLWTKVFQFDTATRITPLDKMPFHQDYFIAGVVLAKALQEEGKAGQALEVARSLPARIPNAIDPWDSRWLQVITLLGEWGDPGLGETIALQVAENYRMDVLDNNDPAAKTEVKDQLASFAKKYGLKKLRKRLRKF
ncbi:MAG: hypothetical protein H6563_08660 [Lewinellaceae bacterium]|nr:hypothetical protein [Lewinellaceae bacterium]